MSTFTATPSLKRKQSDDDAQTVFDHSPRAIKQLRRNVDSASSIITISSDMAMEDMSEPSPISDRSSFSHSPLNAYPNIELYPDMNAMDIDMSSYNPSSGPISPNDQSYRRFASYPPNNNALGLIQPTTQKCSCAAIPRLQVAEHPGLDGERKLFASCPSCGNIDIVQNQ